MLPQEEYDRFTRTEHNRHIPQGAAEAVRRHSRWTPRGDVFGQIYEYFLGKFALQRRPGRRRVLHPALGGAADGGDHRAARRQGVRPRLRFGRHVRAVGPVHRAAPAGRRRPTRTSTSTAGEDTGDRQAGQDEPGGQRPARRDQAGQHLLRRPLRQLRRVRLRAGQSALQRGRRELQPGGEGQALQHLRHAAQQDARPRKATRARRPCPTPTTCGSISLPPR